MTLKRQVLWTLWDGLCHLRAISSTYSESLADQMNYGGHNTIWPLTFCWQFNKIVQWTSLFLRPGPFYLFHLWVDNNLRKILKLKSEPDCKIRKEAREMTVHLTGQADGMLLYFQSFLSVSYVTHSYSSLSVRHKGDTVPVNSASSRHVIFHQALLDSVQPATWEPEERRVQAICPELIGQKCLITLPSFCTCVTGFGSPPGGLTVAVKVVVLRQIIT